MTRLKRNSNRRKRPCQGEPQLLQILQWDAGGMPQEKKIQKQKILDTYSIDVFTIMEYNLMVGKLAYYQFPASEAILKPLEKTHNHALRLITGGIKSTPIDAMLLVTENSTIRSSVEEKALTLYEKPPRISSDKFWSSYKNSPGRLKIQVGLIQKAIELKKRLQTTEKPESLSLLQNPLADNEVKFCTQILGHFMETDIPPDQMRLLAFETINVNYGFKSSLTSKT
nr:hypothetical transcript [Hymenolepis microstoma]